MSEACLKGAPVHAVSLFGFRLFCAIRLQLHLPTHTLNVVKAEGSYFMPLCVVQLGDRAVPVTIAELCGWKGFVAFALTEARLNDVRHQIQQAAVKLIARSRAVSTASDSTVLRAQ